MGTAVRARCPRSPPRHDRPAGAEERSISLGLNPFHCPLPDWADEVHATCRQAEITELEPAVGPSAGGTLVTVTGSNLGSGLPGAGCLFGKRGCRVGARGGSERREGGVRDAAETTGGDDAQRGGASGARGEAITGFGELFRYAS